MFNNTTPLQKDNKCNRERLQNDHARGGQPVGGGLAQVGLSNAHIRPQGKVVLWLDGNLIKVCTGQKCEKKGGGQRGPVVGLSRASRRRMMYMLCQTKKLEKPLMVTLTYPDKFNQNPRIWKRDLKVFLQRLGREYPKAGAIWREELKVRKSGESVGQVAPHFHLLVWGVEYVEMWRFVALAWWGAVGSANDNHLKAGTRVEVIRSADGVKRYAAKYASKSEGDEDLYLEACKRGAVGRVWGIFNSEKIPWSTCDELETSDQATFNLIRLMRRYAHLKMRSNTPSMTLMVSDPWQWLRPLIC